MITKVLLKNFKGQTLTAVLGPKTFIVGPNGSGKTAIAQALELVLTGQITGMQKTTNAIGNAIGAPFTAEVSLGGFDFARSWRRTAADTFAQALYIDRVKVSQQKFDQQLGQCGTPTIWNPEAFFALQPQAKISKLVSMFGGLDLDTTTDEIDTIKSKISTLQAKTGECESSLGRMLQRSAQLNVPAGSLAQVQEEIKTKDLELKAARKHLADLEATERARKKAPPPMDVPQAKGQLQLPPDNPEARAAEDRLKQRIGARGALSFPEPTLSFGIDWRAEAYGLLKKIEDALEAVQCPACKDGLVKAHCKIARNKFGSLDAKASAKGR